jgi:hypothetical protein
MFFVYGGSQPGGKFFAEAKEVEMEARKCRRQLSKDFCAAGFDALVKRWGQVYQCWWRICQEISVIPGLNIMCFMF